jgi:tetratricopeptide (TPR) repeat protein
MAQAPQLALADERRMALLADAMAAHGHGDDAIGVRRMALRLGKPRGWTYYDECRTLCDALMRRGGGPQDINDAADLCQLHALEALDLNGTSPEDVHAARSVHQLRARVLYGSGKFAEAMGEFRAFLTSAPMDIEAALEDVPALRKLGGAAGEAAARELFDLSFKRLDAACTKYPDSAYLHNEIAWLAVRCGYESQAALTHAKRAVELMPRDTASIDTLAEVLFRRGDKAGAVALMKRCEELEPAEAQHRQRREAFEKGNFVAE